MRSQRGPSPGAMISMGNFSWKYLLLANLAVATAIGVQYVVRKSRPRSGDGEVAVLLKPSRFKHAVVGKGKRTPAAQEVKKAKVRDEDVENYAAVEPEAGLAKPMGPPPEGGAASYDSMDEKTRAVPSALPFTGHMCSSLEFRGDGPDGTQVTEEEWARVMTLFHGAKGELLGWLRRYKQELPDKTAYIMEAQVRYLKVQRPPALDEPDLTWRGIGVWSQDLLGEPILRLGSGFLKLVMRNPQRGKFEMTRLVAQSWAPCELQRMDAGAPWEPLLRCMGVSEAQACGFGTYSEAGWAVSSALASLVADPGCTLPVFMQASVAACAKRIPLPLTIAGSPGDLSADRMGMTQAAFEANVEVSL